jgi:hypothetical protein
MRIIRRGAIPVAVAMLVTAAMTAEASAMVAGQGQTHKSATVGIIAKSDGTGELQYRKDDGTFSIHCTRFSSYQESTNAGGFARVEITARKCWRKNGAQRFLRAVFVDRGEPGIAADIVRLWWSRTWPVPFHVPARRRDRGRIQAGNIQILSESVST